MSCHQAHTPNDNVLDKNAVVHEFLSGPIRDTYTAHHAFASFPCCGWMGCSMLLHKKKKNMKFCTTAVLHLLAVAADAATDDKREHAVRTVQQFLAKVVSSSLSERTKVRWDGRFLTPFEPEENLLVPLQEDDDNNESGPLETGATDILPLGRTTMHNDDGGKRRRQRGRLSGASRRHHRRGLGKKGIKSFKGGNASDLKIIRKSVKGSNSLDGSGAEDEILCFRGSPQDVSAACHLYNANCCAGNLNDCSWASDRPPVTVCQGSCNGLQACASLPPNSYIGPESCNGAQACFGTNGNSDKKNPLKIASQSCVGTRACGTICLGSRECAVTIDEYACRGDNACISIAASGGAAVQSVTIGTNACSGGSRPCTFLGRFASDKVQVDEYACLGERACRMMAGTARNMDNVQVEFGACQGDRACQYIGDFSSGSYLQIEQEACYGTRSCRFLGRKASNILVEQEACGSDYSCIQIGYNTEMDIVVEKEACAGYASCQQVGQSTTNGKVTVGEKACVPPMACRALGFDVVLGDVSIGASACDMVEDQCSALVDAACLTTYFIPKDGTSCA